MNPHQAGIRLIGVTLSHVEKSVSPATGKRTVRGLASTNSVDRMGDIVEPGGGSWELPLPLLWNHKHDVPIGWVRSLTSRDAGLWMIGEVAEGVPDADRVWQLIDKGLVNGFSIGFIPRESKPLPKGGLRFVKWDLYEVSVTTIAANQDAKIQRNAPGVPLRQRGDAISLVKATR